MAVAAAAPAGAEEGRGGEVHLDALGVPLELTHFVVFRDGEVCYSEALVRPWGRADSAIRVPLRCLGATEATEYLFHGEGGSDALWYLQSRPGEGVYFRSADLRGEPLPGHMQAYLDTLRDGVPDSGGSLPAERAAPIPPEVGSLGLGRGAAGWGTIAGGLVLALAVMGVARLATRP